MAELRRPKTSLAVVTPDVHYHRLRFSTCDRTDIRVCLRAIHRESLDSCSPGTQDLTPLEVR